MVSFKNIDHDRRLTHWKFIHFLWEPPEFRVLLSRIVRYFYYNKKLNEARIRSQGVLQKMMQTKKLITIYFLNLSLHFLSCFLYKTAR